MSSAFAPGMHLLADFHGVMADLLGDTHALQAALRAAAETAGAHEIAAHFHHFGAGMGVTGMLLLRESHISIHTWPERALAVIDIFMCGHAQPTQALAALQLALAPQSVVIHRVQRGENTAIEAMA